MAGDGTVQLPPEVLGDFPPGTLFTVDRSDGSVSLVPSLSITPDGALGHAAAPPSVGTGPGVPD